MEGAASTHAVIHALRSPYEVSGNEDAAGYDTHEDTWHRMRSAFLKAIGMGSGIGDHKFVEWPHPQVGPPLAGVS